MTDKQTDRPHPETEQGVRAALAEKLANFDGNRFFREKYGPPMSDHDKEIYLKRADEIIAMLTPLPSEGAVAWTNESQLGFLRDPQCAEVPMAMWSRQKPTSNVPLYRAPPSASLGVREALRAFAVYAWGLPEQAVKLLEDFSQRKVLKLSVGLLISISIIYYINQCLRRFTKAIRSIF